MYLCAWDAIRSYHVEVATYLNLYSTDVALLRRFSMRKTQVQDANMEAPMQLACSQVWTVWTRN